MGFAMYNAMYICDIIADFIAVSHFAGSDTLATVCTTY
jgi:hypothetical protein